MPVSFSRLRIAGFKSFAEPAVVDIRPGLTGIVGPNGCGKSNVVEALRWAMGENSPEIDARRRDGRRDLRRHRRPPVAQHRRGDAAAGRDARAWRRRRSTSMPELEISRRIERGHGSIYRVNGREARARDVQTLFADLATGAHSSGMVSQGRVGAPSSTPSRTSAARILEEAAGITGLHARRHEAELKLRAAEANLARAEDLRGQLEAQLEGLKRQARQANRYRNISGTIRSAEAELLALQRARVDAARAAAAGGAARGRRRPSPRRPRPRPPPPPAPPRPPPRCRRCATREAEARTALERHRVGRRADRRRGGAGASRACTPPAQRLRADRQRPRPCRAVAARRGGRRARLGEEEAAPCRRG